MAIPSTSGRVQLPSFELADFDPSAKQYATARTGKITLDVTPGQEVAQVSMAAPTGKSVELMGEDIRFIKPDITYLADQSLYLHQSGWIWSLNGLPALGLLIAWQWRRRQQQLLGDVAYVRKRRSRTEADRRLGEARHLQEGDGVGFHTEIQSTVSAFLSDRLNLDVAGLTADQAPALLTEKTVDAVVITQVVEVLQACDYARFAPGASDVSDRADLLNKTQVLIDALERAV